MLHVCPHCGAFRRRKIVARVAQTLFCPACGTQLPHPQFPLFILGGASGAGKSTICQALLARQPDYVVLDSDILWSDDFAAPAQWPRYFDLWLRLAKSISFSGRPVLLAGAGLGVPDNIVNTPEARYLTAIHILALVCDDDHLAHRLRSRPTWRATGDPVTIDNQIQFNRWYKHAASINSNQIACFDTTHATLDATVDAVDQWVRHHALAASPAETSQP